MEHASSGGCLFHFTKAIQRKVDGLGFRQKYSDDTSFRRRVMALSTLAYLPLPYVECAFDSLKMEFLVDELPIVEYFEHTYVGTDRVNSRHPIALRSRPIFAPAFWNVHGRYLFGFPTTTNAVERFHLTQQQLLHNTSHPSIPVFLEGLHRQLAFVDLRVGAIEGGERRYPGVTFTRKMDKFMSILRALTPDNVMQILSQLTIFRLHQTDIVGGRPFQISSQGSVGHVSDTETVQNELLDESPEFAVPSGSQPPPVDVPQNLPSPVVGSPPGLVDEPALQTPMLPTAALAIAKAVHPKASAIPPAIHLQDSASWLVDAGYDQGSHGPHDCLALQQTLLNITVSRSRIVSLSNRGMWTFQFCIQQTACKGCNGIMLKNCPRLSWDPRTTQRPEGLRAMPGFNRGNWHVSCAILASKIVVPGNCLLKVDMAMVCQLPGATAVDAPIIEAMAEKQYVFLRASLGVREAGTSKIEGGHWKPDRDRSIPKLR